MYTFADVLIKPKFSNILSRSTIDISSYLTPTLQLKIPVIAANMKTICGPAMAIEIAQEGGLGILHRFNTISEAVQDFEKFVKENSETSCCGVSIGVQEDDKQRADELYKVGARIFTIDIAHGHHLLLQQMTEYLRQKYQNKIVIIGGNIATKEAVIDLSKWGVDIVKVGIGPGAVCTTRQKTGVGVPQLYALEQVSDVIEENKLDTRIISDGGIVNIGDISKALKYAHAVMVGNLIAGTSETPGYVFTDPNGQFYKVYGGSASGENRNTNHFVEGVMKTVPFRGKVKFILRSIKEGIQSAFSYVGATNLEEFQLRCDFLTLSGNSVKESKF